MRLTPNVNGNGRFAFDSFRLEVCQPGGTWQPVPLVNGNLETPAPADSSATRSPTGWRPSPPVAGEKDVIKDAPTRLIAASIPGAQVLILPGLTHYAPQETPALFNQVVLDFLAKHE